VGLKVLKVYSPFGFDLMSLDDGYPLFCVIREFQRNSCEVCSWCTQINGQLWKDVRDLL